jgi:eukaryotic-like serine/threonine-protein kinase
MSEGGRTTPPLPKSIGRYQILGGLGAGAMGAVYKGFDPLIKRTLAIKTIRLDIPRGSEEYKNFLERFYQEARISGTLSHPNIVTLFDIGEDQGQPFLALEFVEGETVESQIDRGAKFRPEKVISIVSQVASALDYAHSKGVIHRDVKPANLMLCVRGGIPDHVKILDFGLVKELHAEADVGLSVAGALLGTPLYMAPEAIVDSEHVDARVDIYALGAVAYQLLAGVPPFSGTGLVEICAKHLHEAPRPPSEHAREPVPAGLERLVLACLAKRPAERPASAARLLDALDALDDVPAWNQAAAESWWRDTPLRIRHKSRESAPPRSGARTVAIDLERRLPTG